VIVLDTNVLSALMLERPDRAVVEWLDTVPAESVWTTAITVFEIRFGLEIIAEGRRRTRLEQAFGRWLDEDLERRVLPFDGPSAEAAGRIAADARAAGRTIEVQDAQIAGTVRVRRGALATGHGRHFRDAGIPLIDPWRRPGP
jgi:predicted nucleic acid-binding protein